MFLNIIPSRSGSKRIKNKNLIKIDGGSFLDKTILISLKIKDSYTLVSSDSENYLKKAEKISNNIFLHKRSKKNSRDKSTDFDYISEVIKYTNNLDIKYKFINILRPNVQIRRIHEINRIIDYFKKTKFDSLRSVSVVPTEFHPLNVYKQDNIKIKKYIPNFNFFRSQELSTTYSPNGYLDIINKNDVRAGKIFNNKNCGFFTNTHEFFDIDTNQDLKNFRKFYSRL